jgi:hypothetical protein
LEKKRLFWPFLFFEIFYKMWNIIFKISLKRLINTFLTLKDGFYHWNFIKIVFLDKKVNKILKQCTTPFFTNEARLGKRFFIRKSLYHFQCFYRPVPLFYLKNWIKLCLNFKFFGVRIQTLKLENFIFHGIIYSISFVFAPSPLLSRPITINFSKLSHIIFFWYFETIWRNGNGTRR